MLSRFLIPIYFLSFTKDYDVLFHYFSCISIGTIVVNRTSKSFLQPLLFRFTIYMTELGSKDSIMSFFFLILKLTSLFIYMYRFLHVIRILFFNCLYHYCPSHKHILNNHFRYTLGIFKCVLH